MMDPYRGRELKTKGLHWKRMKGLEAVRRSERTHYLGGELCDEHLKELNSIQGYVVNKEIESSSSRLDGH
jgi:hypothetical protein